MPAKSPGNRMVIRSSSAGAAPALNEVVIESNSGSSLALRSSTSRRRATVASLWDPSASSRTSDEERVRRRSRPNLQRAATQNVSTSAEQSVKGSALSVPPALPARCDSRLEFFHAGMAGMRSHMEDRTLVVPELAGSEGAALWGVFDGHGGGEVADLAKELLPKIIEDSLARNKDPQLALQQAFAQCDQAIRAAAMSHSSGFDRVGCTASIVLAVRRFGRLRLLCANCGDSRAVLSRGGVAVELSQDHKPHDPVERRRIEAAGGKVLIYDTCGRIDGCLAVSRALGDFRYKARSDLALDKQMVIPVPDVKEIPVGKCDEFVAVGTDGIFTRLTAEELVGQLGASRRRGLSWDKAIAGVLEHTQLGGDNVSLCIAHFNH